MMWYTTSTALAIIASIDDKPAVQWHEKRFPMTTDRWATFTGEAHAQLHRLWSEAFLADPTVAFVSPDDVLGALFGDPEGNERFRTYRDDSEDWTAIRRDVAAAFEPEWAEAAE